jgi:hypothetical protein
VTSLGADEPGKAELSAGLLRGGHVIVDDVSLAVAMGALGSAGLSSGDAAGTLAQVLQGQVPGRRSAGQITIYAPVGLPGRTWRLPGWPIAVPWTPAPACRSIPELRRVSGGRPNVFSAGGFADLKDVDGFERWLVVDPYRPPQLDSFRPWECAARPWHTWDEATLTMHRGNWPMAPR